MSERAREAVMRRRLASALLVVVALIASVPVSGAFIGKAPAAETNAPPFTGVHAQALSHAGDIDSMANLLEDMARAGGEASVPAWFQRDIGFLPDARDVRTDGISTVGYLVDDVGDDVLVSLIAHMEARGWTAVPLGDVEGATFVRQAGTCTWALATCTPVGSPTSIVFRCAQATQ